MEKFKYTITKFDEENKFIVVSFEDGSWAEIKLTLPFPDSKEELEKLISRFVAPYEHMVAKQTTANLSFIHTLVGSENEAQRLVLFPEVKAAIDGSTEVTTDNEMLDEFERARLKQAIIDILAELNTSTGV